MLAKDTLYPQGHQPGMANFATLTAHIVNNNQGSFDFSGDSVEEFVGLYVNVEQPDKSFLKNRLLWESDQTYLYKAGDLNSSVDRKEVGCEDDATKIDSPTYKDLDCVPFRTGSDVEDCMFDELLEKIDMEVMLSMGAIEAFMS